MSKPNLAEIIRTESELIRLQREIPAAQVRLTKIPHTDIRSYSQLHLKIGEMQLAYRENLESYRKLTGREYDKTN